MNLITALTVLIASMHLATAESNYVYNTEMTDEVVTQQMVYKTSRDGRFLKNYLKYAFVYDDQECLKQKEVMKWNEEKQQWEKSHSLYYIYDQAGFSVNYALWNPKQADYSEVVAKQAYNQLPGGDVAVTLYRWDEASEDWAMQNSFQMAQAENNLMAARN